MTAHGAYTLIDSPTGTVDVILIATGSEVQLAISARDELALTGIGARVVSAPCLEWFAEQSAEYRESVLPAAVTARVSVEAGLSLGWSSLVGERGHSVSIEHFGASADYQTLFTEFGVTTAAVTAAAVSVLAR
jgi:transketolase